MSKTLDLLLNKSVEKMKMPRKEYEIKRLSEAFEAPFIVTLRALTIQEVQDLNEKAYDVEKQVVDQMKLLTYMVIDGMVDPNIKDKEIRKKLNLNTPNDFIQNYFTIGEVQFLGEQVAKLSHLGVAGEEVITEIKN